MASVREKQRRRQGKPKRKLPRTVEQYRALPERSQDALQRAANVLTDMRRGTALTRAARDAGIDPRTVRRLAGSSLKKTASGRYAASKSDRIVRMLVIPTPRGVAEIATRGSRDAIVLAEYWNAVQLFLETGDDAALSHFAGRAITNARGERVVLITDPDELERLGSVGVLSFESLYARVA